VSYANVSIILLFEQNEMATMTMMTMGLSVEAERERI